MVNDQEFVDKMEELHHPVHYHTSERLKCSECKKRWPCPTLELMFAQMMNGVDVGG